jgi:hypothetical protein
MSERPAAILILERQIINFTSEDHNSSLLHSLGFFAIECPCFKQ